jgi:polyisoprenoid-binding protein YceI
VLKKASISHKPHTGLPWSVWNTTGTLTAAGHPKQVHLQLKVLTARNGTIAIETRTVLKMTDFGISPPTAMLGAIRSGNRIHIKVLWNLTPRK